MATDIVIPQTEAGTGDFYQFEPGIYDAVVTNIEEVPNPFEDGETQLEFTFTVPGYENEDGSVATRRGWANPTFNTKSKLYGWAANILGRAIATDESFRTSMLIDKPCRLVLNAGFNMKKEPIIKLTDVMGPAKAAPATKKGLAASVKANPPAGTRVEESIGACVLCGEPGTKYTGKGAPICEECS